MLGIDGHRRNDLPRRRRDLVVPPHVATFLHRRRALVADSPDDEHFLDRRTLGHGRVGIVFQRHHVAAAIAAVGGDQDLGLAVVDPVAQRMRAEAAKHDAMRCTQAGAGQQRDGQLGNHRQVDRDAVALFDAQPLQRGGGSIDLPIQIVVGQHAVVARFTFPDNRRLVLARPVQVAVDAVVARVQLAADEPLHPGGIPFENLVERLEPIERFRLLGPESLGIGFGSGIDRGIVGVRLGRKLGSWRVTPLFLEKCFDRAGIGIGHRPQTSPSSIGFTIDRSTVAD